MSAKAAIRAAVARRRLRWAGRLRRALGLVPPELTEYSMMESDNRLAAAHYQAGAFWQQINRDFRDLIYAGALTTLRNEYFNRRFAAPAPGSWQVYEALLRLYYLRLTAGPAASFLANSEEPTCGGTADQLLVEGRLMSLDFLQSVDEAFQIREAWQLARLPDEPRLIVELGAGYGRLAYICRKVFPACTYVILDLPEALICSSSWLTRVLPGEVVPYENSRRLKELSRSTLDAERVWLLGAHQIEQLCDASVDVFLNIYSFAEMPPSSINNYLVHVDRITRGILYTKQRKVEVNVDDHVRVAMDEYLTRPGWAPLFFRTSPLYEVVFEAALAVHTGKGANDGSLRAPRSSQSETN